ncbi:MAG: hypothetical protein DRJ26_00935 [Candidatus Methanomethylicota archaeon]|uniref:Uncharacterized protein n=1 Tax=Thermoproteota archaeon TaxID=2056631 RepID=A0A497F8F7_9CREN|nr:MAG: hypothetical protein DRJ26_00935 [Candidatus Verstraetearchaeota archaeon]
MSGLLSFAGRVKCFHEFEHSDMLEYENEIINSLRKEWGFTGESEGYINFVEGSISNLKIIADYTLNKVVSRFDFSNVKRLDDVAKLLRAVLECSSLCNLFMVVKGLTSENIARIRRVTRRFKCRGLIEGGDPQTFRCSLLLDKYAFSLAVYGDLSIIEVLARLKDKREVDKLITSLKLMLRPSLARRILSKFSSRF